MAFVSYLGRKMDISTTYIGYNQDADWVVGKTMSSNWDTLYDTQLEMYIR